MNFVKKSVKTVLIILSSFFGIWFVLPMLRGVVCFGNVFGVLICGFVFLHCVFNDRFKELKFRFYKKKFTKFLWRLCQTGLVIFVLYALTISSAMIYFSTIAPKDNATMITLGAMVRSGGVPSGSLNKRINASYDYLQQHKGAVDILSGGQGDNECMSEARCMYNYLTKMGINPNRLIMEDKSVNTQSNIKNSLKIIKDKSLSEDIAIVTDGYHQLRARIIAKKLGIKGDIGAVNSKTPLSVFPTYFVREWFALPVEVLK